MAQGAHRGTCAGFQAVTTEPEMPPRIAAPGGASLPDQPSSLEQQPAQARQAREWRKRAGFSIEQLARLTGYSANHISMIERQVRDPKPRSWLRYKLACAAALLGVEFDWTDVKLATPEKVFRVELRALQARPRPPAADKGSDDEGAASIAVRPDDGASDLSEPEPQSGPDQEPPAPAAD